MISLSFLSNEWLQSLFFNFIVIALAQRFPLLTKSGWVHAGILGTILLACLGWSGWLAVAIYLALGSIVTKLGFKYKKSKGIAEARNGRRGPENVWGSAATGAVLALLIKLQFGSQFVLLVGFAASFAAKLADTFGSEIGKRWGRTTVLITTLRPVPPGTEGAISFEGTLASALGSILMTIVMFMVSIISNYSIALVVVISGFLATILESIFGAVAQDKFSWCSNEMVNFFQTSVASILAILFTMILISD
tara:strand:- start:69 stop:818 length:750 start_codon:yes stop_codon:yes gene_type:complete